MKAHPFLSFSPSPVHACMRACERLCVRERTCDYVFGVRGMSTVEPRAHVTECIIA